MYHDIKAVLFKDSFFIFSQISQVYCAAIILLTDVVGAQ